MQIRRALISVSDKTGVVELGRALVTHGVEIVSSEGPRPPWPGRALPVTPVSDVSGAPEILGGRVKTLHPASTRRDPRGQKGDPQHSEQLEQQGIAFELVVRNSTHSRTNPGRH